MTGLDALLILLAHGVGDYVIQSDWMATEKTSRWVPAALHALTYTLAYVVVTRSLLALLVIGGTHYLIDRYRLARHVVYAKNLLSPRSTWLTWEACKATGYDGAKAPFMAVWLMIIADNVIHLIINTAAVLWL